MFKNIKSVWSTETGGSFPKCSVYLGNSGNIQSVERVEQRLCEQFNKELIYCGMLPFKALQRNRNQWLPRLPVEGDHPTF